MKEFIGFLPMIAVFGIMYFMLIVPQRKREKKTQEMLKALQIGNDVITVGGIIGKIINIKDDEITIETSVEKTQIKFVRQAVKEVVQSTES